MTINPYAVAPAASEQPLVAELVDQQAAWTFDFTLDLDDVLRWNAYFHKKSPAMRQRFYIAWGVCGFALLFSVGLVPWLLLPNQPLDWPALAALAVFAAAAWAGYPWLYRWKVERATRAVYSQVAARAIFGPRRIAITPQYAAYSTPLMQTIARWSAVQEIVVDRNDVFIVLAQIHAFVIPARAFANDAQREQFVRAAEEFRQRATANV